ELPRGRGPEEALKLVQDAATKRVEPRHDEHGVDLCTQCEPVADVQDRWSVDEHEVGTKAKLAQDRRQAFARHELARIRGNSPGGENVEHGSRSPVAVAAIRIT